MRLWPFSNRKLHGMHALSEEEYQANKAAYEAKQAAKAEK